MGHFQSHHNGIEMEILEKYTRGINPSNRTIMELKYRKRSPEGSRLDHFQSHHNGIEIAESVWPVCPGKDFQSHHNGIEMY